MHSADKLCEPDQNNTGTSPPNGDTCEVPERLLYSQRNKSTGNLLPKPPGTAERGRVRYSIDAGTAQELNMAKWVP